MKAIIVEYRALYAKAKAMAKQKKDRSVTEAEVFRELKKIVPFNEDAMREHEAKRVIDAVCKAVPGEIFGQLYFDGFDPWDYDPERIIRSDDGDLIENRLATIRFKVADAQRSNKHADDALASSRRKQHEANVFMRWTVEQLTAGANPETLTWEACLESLGVLIPATV